MGGRPDGGVRLNLARRVPACVNAIRSVIAPPSGRRLLVMSRWMENASTGSERSIFCTFRFICAGTRLIFRCVAISSDAGKQRIRSSIG